MLTQETTIRSDVNFPSLRGGALAALVIAQTYHCGTLHCRESTRCDQCRLVSEADGNEVPPSMIQRSADQDLIDYSYGFSLGQKA
jgi:hypothetical protein